MCCASPVPQNDLLFSGVIQSEEGRKDRCMRKGALLMIQYVYVSKSYSAKYLSFLLYLFHCFLYLF